ncbi:MAG: hypothetical protein ACI358_09585 [Candidatus Limimorpha sp.]
MRKSRSSRLFVFAFIMSLLSSLLFSCSDVPQPKPRGYFRIALPEKQYATLDSMRFYSFEYPLYSTITPDFHSVEEKDWINIEFPSFKGTIHISYKKVEGNLSNYIEDSYQMITKHITKATGIRDSVVMESDRDVFGLVYFLDGEGVASPLQFYLTDSVSHFLRGSLYFNVYPNNDSLQPVIDFITDDARHIINTLKWK